MFLKYVVVDIVNADLSVIFCILVGWSKTKHNSLLSCIHLMSTF